jgi:hypothetical protein
MLYPPRSERLGALPNARCGARNNREAMTTGVEQFCFADVPHRLQRLVNERHHIVATAVRSLTFAEGAMKALPLCHGGERVRYSQLPQHSAYFATAQPGAGITQSLNAVGCGTGLANDPGNLAARSQRPTQSKLSGFSETNSDPRTPSIRCKVIQIVRRIAGRERLLGLWCPRSIAARGAFLAKYSAVAQAAVRVD